MTKIHHQQVLRDWITKICNDHDVTTSEIAKRANVVPSTINRFMNNPDTTHQLSTVTIQKIMTAFRIGHPFENVLDESKTNKLGLILGLQRAPLVSWSDIAMIGLNLDQKFTDLLGETKNVVHVRHDRETVVALEIVDNVMDAVAPVGSVIYIDFSDRALIDDTYYVFKFRDVAIFRRYRAKPDRLEPRGMIHRDETIYPIAADNLTVFGRVFHIGRDI